MDFSDVNRLEKSDVSKFFRPDRLALTIMMLILIKQH